VKLNRVNLTILGKSDGFKEEQLELRHREFDLGNYKRIFSLSQEVDIDGIEAKINGGVLTVTIPKSEATQPRKISIQS